MATNLRGQLGVKSGPLAPTSAKLTTQMLVVSHMENHYKKISKARPAIDNGPPKSMQSSQKLRDKRTKKVIETYGSRPASRVSYRSHSAEDDIYDERQWEEPEDDEERQVREIMRTTLRVPLKANHNIGSVNATDGSKSESANFQTTTMRPQSATMRGVAQAMRGLSHMNRTRPASARSTTSLVSNFSQTSRSSNPMKATYNGDVIEKHAHNFTEPTKPFTPRTLKSNRESSLKRYKYYTPPPKKSQQGTHREAGSAINGDTIVKEAPQAKPRARSAKGGGDMGATGTLTETMLMDMSLQSHDPRQNSASSKGIPRLDISMDKDHLSWVQDQATRAHIRTSNGTSVQSQDRAHHDGGDTLGETGTLGKTDTLRFTRTGSSAKSFGVKSPTSRRLGQAEEEQKYVAFAHEVTQDIINQGISSDRVLQKVFDNHVDRKKDELDERRLRAIITDIRRDLGVQHVGPVEKRVQYNQDLDQTEIYNGDMTTGTMASGDSTLSDANNTYNFNRTTDVFSTIHSQPGEGEDLSNTLQQYQMELTVKDNAEYQNSESNGLDDKEEALGSTLVNGDADTETEESEKVSVAESEKASVSEEPRPAARPRRLTRQDASTAGQETASRQVSVTDTEAKTEEEEEGVEEEYEYEDDYDADEDDVTAKGSDDDF